MPSFALEHRRKILEQQQSLKKELDLTTSFAERSQNMRETNSTFNATLSALDVAKQVVSNEPQGRQRHAKKRAYVQEFLPTVHAYVNEGISYANALLTQLMIWAFDSGDIVSAEYLSDICLKEKQALPDRFGRTLETVIADCFLEYGQSIEDKTLKIEFFETKFAHIKTWYIHDEIKSKYAKVLGGTYFELKQFDLALKWFNLSKEIDPKAKVKTVVEQCIKHLEKQT